MAMRSKTGDLIVPTPKNLVKGVGNIQSMPQLLATSSS